MRHGAHEPLVQTLLLQIVPHVPQFFQSLERLTQRLEQ